MTDNTTTYYFSKKVLMEPLAWLAIPGFVVAFLLIFSPPVIYSFLLLPFALLFLVIKLPDSLKKIYFFSIKEPALVIDKRCLVDNINGQKYEWTDILGITFSEKHKAICINIGESNIDKYVRNKRLFLAKWLLKFDLGISHGTFFIGKQFIDTNNTSLDNLVRFHALIRA